MDVNLASNVINLLYWTWLSMLAILRRRTGGVVPSIPWLYTLPVRRYIEHACVITLRKPYSVTLSTF